jgi:L-ectoine synthase
MIVRKREELEVSGRVVCPSDGVFISHRYLLESDRMGYTMTETRIPKCEAWHYWHYKNHLEACLCVSGAALIKNALSGEVHRIEPGTLYALDCNDPHYFKAIEDTVLVCVFNPPLKGTELHREDGSYE